MTIEMHHGQPDNLLLAYLMDTYKKIKPHTTMILAGALVVMALFYAYRWWDAKNEAQIIETYAEMFDALSARDADSIQRLEEIADAYAGLPEGEMAQLFAADQQMLASTMELYTNKESARLDIESAIEGYEIVAESDDPENRRKALFGLARAHETRAATRSSNHSVEESLDAAEETYSALIEEFPGTLEAKLAERRRTEIARPSVHDYYKKFASWDQTEEPETPAGMPPIDLNQLMEGSTTGSDFPGGTSSLPTIPPLLDLTGDDTLEEPVEGTEGETTDPVESTETTETTEPTDADPEVVEPVVEEADPVDADADATEEVTETP